MQSYTTKNNNGSISLVQGRVKLPKMGLVRISKSREVEGRIISATITRKSSGKYFVSLLCEAETAAFSKTGTAVDIDLGITHFAFLSDGTPPLKNLRPFRSLEKKLAKEQRILSRRRVQAKKDVKDLAVREWDCPQCGTNHDRDFNASINIRVEAQRLFVLKPGESPGLA